MAAYLDNGRLIDWIVALLALEALALSAVRALFGLGPSVTSTIANCTAGGALFLALRAAMANAPFPVIGACLLVALVAHVADLATRWRGSPRAFTRPSHSASASAALASENSRV
jgi:Na+/phosphate symporter